MAEEVKAQAYPLVTKEEAKALGLKIYTLGTRPCKYGHPVGREVCSGRCKICSDALGAKWRLENPEKRKASVVKYWQNNKEACRERAKVWNANNPEVVQAAGKAFRLRHPERHAASVRNRWALLRSAEGKHTAKDIGMILKCQGFSCFVCEVDISNSYHVDHIVPLTRGGSNWPSNLQALCPSCNLRKHNKLMHEWLPAEHPALKKR